MSQAISPISMPAIGSRRGLWAFLTVAIVLLVAGFGLNTTVTKMQLSFRKLPVDPAHPLKTIASELGPWTQVSVDRALSPDFEHALGASEYLFRDYVDIRKLPPADKKALLSGNLEDREKLRQRLNIDPQQRIRFALTYYTGSVDTVPHVPDRCYAADGFKPDTYQIVTWPVLPRADAAERNTGVRLINFVDQIDSRNSRPRQVSYFFQVNGAYEQDPVDGVRVRLQNLFDRRAYFAKIELVTDLPDPADASAVMTDFLQNAMPEIERVLPDWKKVNH